MSRAPVTTVGVVGAGVMGVGITEVLVSAGVDVRLHDPSDRARDSVAERLAASREAHDLPAGPTDGDWSVHATLDELVAGTDLVLDASPEEPDLKARIFGDLDRLTPPNVLLASNSSSIPVSVVATRTRHPGRVLGMHFWNPPALVRLVEVVRAAATDPDLADLAVDFLHECGMTPVLVTKDVPGIVGNRLQHALKREAIALVAEGVCTAETVDLVVTSGFGARLGAVGPLEQSDLSGLDLTLAIHQVLMPSLDVTPVAHPYLVELVDRGDLGARTGRGFRSWTPEQAEQRRQEIAHQLTELARRRGSDG